MPEAFRVAAVRHFRDGTLLERETRVSNSDQAFGFAAECAIKSALVELPGLIAADNRLERRYREHIDVLWGRVLVQSVQRRYPGLATLLQATNPFVDWSTDLRYDEDDAVSAPVRDRHRVSAKRLLGAVGLLGLRPSSTP